MWFAVRSTHEEDQRSLCTLVWHCGSQRAKLWETQETDAPITCATSGPLLLRREGRWNCPEWLRLLFLYMVFFCFVLCFGTKCVEVKLNTWNAFTIQFPHTHSTKMSFSFFFFFWYCCGACGILVPRPGMKPMPSAMAVWSLNPWATREVQAILSLPGASLEKGSALHQRLMCFVIKEHQVSSWTPPLGGQNLNCNTESRKTQQ